MSFFSSFNSHNGFVLLQWTCSLQHCSWSVSRRQRCGSHLLHDLPHHPEGVLRLHRSLEDGPRSGWQYHSVHGPQGFSLQVTARLCLTQKGHFHFHPWLGNCDSYHSHEIISLWKLRWLRLDFCWTQSSRVGERSVINQCTANKTFMVCWKCLTFIIEFKHPIPLSSYSAVTTLLC